MSAFVCSPKVIGILAQAIYLRYQNKPAVWHTEVSQPHELAEALAETNLRSVAHRYRMTPAQAAKDFIGKSRTQYLKACVEAAESAEVRQEAEGLTPQRLWGYAAGYTYQACEHPSYEQDFGYKVAETLETDLRFQCRTLRVERDGWV